jgi:hypothetical protein
VSASDIPGSDYIFSALGVSRHSVETPAID